MSQIGSGLACDLLGQEFERKIVMVTSVVLDRKDKFREGASKALMMKMGQDKPDYANEYLSMSLVQLCKASLAVNHVDATGFDVRKIGSLALQPGADFPGILDNVATKLVLKGYSAKPEA
ncbi:MAG: hypothetical protein ACJAR0_002793 [Candidatus Azotimanducaceae bacterium]|jgi:hypothetical protein